MSFNRLPPEAVFLFYKVMPSPILNLTNLLGSKLKLIFMKNLELTQMEHLSGGERDILTDASACNEIATGLGGTAVIFGVASWWTGAGAGISAVIGVVAYAGSLYCDTL